MKLIIISDAWHPQVNGVVRTYEHLSEEMVKRGHNVRVIGPADFKRSMAMPGYDEIRLVLFPYRALKKKIEEFAPDAIHISTEGPLGQAARRYCLKHGRVFTSSYHTHFPDYVAARVGKRLPFLYNITHKLAKSYIRSFHQKSGAMMIATQSLEDELRSWGFTAPMHRVTRGANLDMYFPAVSEDDKDAFPADMPRPIALYVGRVAIEKNIEAFLDMEWEGSKVIVGDGPSLTELKERYQDAHFVGKKLGEDLAAHYRSADLFVFPSKTDTFGIVLIEALASGLPVAGYDVTGPKDIITNAALGALTDDNDLALAAREALSAPASDIDRADHVKGYYTWQNAAAQYEEAILTSLGKLETETQPTESEHKKSA